MFKKMKNKKGFTLAELLIVIAIIAVLIAIAVPVFSSSMKRANQATDAANIRAAKAAGVAMYLDQAYGTVTGSPDASGITTYYMTKGGDLKAGSSGDDALKTRIAHSATDPNPNLASIGNVADSYAKDAAITVKIGPSGGVGLMGANPPEVTSPGAGG